MSKLDKWADYLRSEELARYAKGKFGERVGFRGKAALLNIDATYMFVDPVFPQCGDGDPELVNNITRLVAEFRTLGLPIYYSRRDDRTHPIRRSM
jgi:maleamate amidohydrolase